VQQKNSPWTRRDRASLQTGAHSPPPSLSSPETYYVAPESQEGGSVLKPGSKSCPPTTFTFIYCMYACVCRTFDEKAI
jgi:hypothetical protein